MSAKHVQLFTHSCTQPSSYTKSTTVDSRDATFKNKYTFSLSSSFVPTSICDVVCAITHSHLSEDARPHSCTTGAWQVRKQFGAHHVQRGRSKPSWWIVGSVTLNIMEIFWDQPDSVWLTTISCNQPLDKKWSTRLKYFEKTVCLQMLDYSMKCCVHKKLTNENGM